MTQLVELQQALPKFEAAGIKLYGVSYDTVDALQAFAKAHDITFPLLSDLGSKVIRRFGIQNTNLTKDQIPFYGVPFPGTYLLDEDGHITAKFFHRNLAARESPEAVIDSALGEILLGEDEPSDQTGDNSIAITAALHGGKSLRNSAPRQLVVRFELAEGLHIYDKPVPEGMVATTITATGPEGLVVGTVIQPPTKPLTLPGLASPLRVWEGRVDFVLPLSVDDRLSGIVNAPQKDRITIEIEVAYQACDDKACHIPQKARLSLDVPVTGYVTPNLFGSRFDGPQSGMDSRKYMQRMIRRGLLRSPIKGARFLKRLTQNFKTGPLGRRKP